MISKSGAKELLKDLLFDIAGSFFVAVSIQCFSAPNNIAPGGVSGIAILIEYLFAIPISATNLLLNIPLLILAWFFLGRHFTLKTLKSVIILTAMLLLCEWLPAYSGNHLLAALYSGVLQGAGLAAVFARSSTTGGTDIASRLIQLRFPHISVGKILIAVDFIILAASALVYRNIESALYALIAIFTSGRIIDSVLYSLDVGKVMMIVSEKHEEIAQQIHSVLGRGCTVLQGAGSYTGENRPVLMCAVRIRQFVELKRFIKTIDSRAFIMVLEANEVIGEGFKNMHHDSI